MTSTIVKSISIPIVDIIYPKNHICVIRSSTYFNGHIGYPLLELQRPNVNALSDN